MRTREQRDAIIEQMRKASDIIDRARERCEQQGGGERVLHSPCKWCVHGEIASALHMISRHVNIAVAVSFVLGLLAGAFLFATMRCP